MTLTRQIAPSKIDMQQFDKLLSEVSVKPDSILIHPSRYRFSEDKTRMYIIFFSNDVLCYRDGICIGEAVSLKDAIDWVDNDKEIEMWT